ncbi:hypothetical protein L1987_57765 [Smallanthus sonchifolius]|uniref:Uncharacterized protein n=1 Tax=Smallanthus sonchifolius TaxID=185202 RepID=A0ACB9DDW5_9ASTR|nr:hypothetical protein L1987_57765 [Smallanthus sonchifolius]
MTSLAHPIYISDDDDVHEVIVIPDPEIFNVSDDEAEVDPDVLEAGDESELESDYEEDPEEMTDVEHEAPEPEVDKEILPPCKRKLATNFGEEDTVPPPPPKSARANVIVEDDDTSDEEPPSTF